MHSDTGIHIHRISRLLKAEFERRVQGSRLTLTQWRTLGVLLREDAPTQRALADHLEIAPMTISDQIDRLEAMGCVQRENDPDDARAKRVRLLPEGRALALGMRPVVESVYAQALAGLDDDDIAALDRMLQTIIDNLTAAATPDGPGDMTDTLTR
ncbi:MAG: winged helix-turn-helix transcriptional regulator [Rubellimicrobium sp.]|nr:winged helix-turn-helix transcriptional regulator [Rubellimicrobium sp.]